MTPAECGELIQGEIQRLRHQVSLLETRLMGYETAAIITNDHLSRALRMGQQQGRTELATELLGMTLTERDHYLNSIVHEDT